MARATPGLWGSVVAVLGLGAEIGLTRLELAGVELEEERLHLFSQAVLALAVLALLHLGVLLLALLVVLVFWDGPRVLALSLVVASCWLAGALLAWRVLQRERRRPPLLGATLAELRADRDALRDAVCRGL